MKLISICVVLVGGPRSAGLAGLIYLLAGVFMTAHGFLMGSRRRRLEKRAIESITESAWNEEIISNR